MDFSKLNKKIVVQQIKKELKNGVNIEIYEDVKTVWAEIKNLNGKEFFEAQQVKSKISKKIKIRYLKILDPSIYINATMDYRILYNGFPYNIVYIDNIREENRFMELAVEDD